MPPYTLAPITAVDRKEITTIFCTSYATNPWFRLQYSSLPIADILPGFALRFPAGNLAKENAWHLKLLDAAHNDNNEPIAFARWILPERLFERLDEELESEGGRMALRGESEENLLKYKQEREQGYVDGEAIGMNPSVPAQLSEELKTMRANAPAPPAEFIELDALHTLPEHERKGAGTTLLQWGTELADREGLPIRLLSTPYGFAFYKKFGFVELGRATVDLARCGGSGDFTMVLMSREPESAAKA